MRRVLAALLSILLTLLVLALGAAGWLLFTTSGARWLAARVVAVEPRLTVTVEAGALASGVELADLAWRDGPLELAAARAAFAWTPSCLLAPAVCLDRVALGGLHIQLRPAPEAAAPVNADPAAPAAATGRIRLPLPVRVALLQVTDARLVLPDGEYAIRNLQASGDLTGDTLTLDWLRLERLEAAVVAAPAETEAPAPAAIELPTVALPLDLVVRSLVLDDADLVIGERQLLLDQLAFTGSLRGPELAVERLQLVLPQLQAQAEGQITLAGDYPLAVSLKALASGQNLPAPVRLSAGLNGSVRELAVTADLLEPLAVHAEASLQPLADGLPFDLEASWQEAALPVGGEPALVLREGRLDAAGMLAGYTGVAAAAVAGPRVPEGRFQARFAGDREQVRIERLDGRTLDGSVVADGLLRWADGLRWQARLTAQALNPGVQWPDFPGRLDGRLELRGRSTERGMSFASTAGIDGRLRDAPLAVRGGMQKSADDVWRIEGLRVASGDSRLEVDGRLGDSWDLQGRLQLADAGLLAPELAGALSGRFALAGAVAEPDLALTLQGSRLRYQDHAIARLELEADVRRLAFGQSRLRWAATGVHVADQPLGRVHGELAGDRAAHGLTLAASGGEFGGTLRLAGALDEQLNWSGRLQEAALALPPRQQWALAEPVELRWDNGRREFALTAHCWRRQEARLCLQAPATLGERGALELALSDFRIDWLAPWLPEGVRWEAPLRAQAQLRWQPDAPASARAELVSDGGRVVLEQDAGEPLVLAYDRIGGGLVLADNALSVDLALASERLGAGRIGVRTRLAPKPRPLAGEIALEGLQLGLLRVFLPQVQTLAGTVSAHGRLDGTLQDPRFVGDLRLADGALAAAGLPMSLTDIRLAADIAGSSASLNGSFRSGDGSARLRGSADWGGEQWQLDLALNGEQLDVVYPPVARLRVSPNLNVRVQPRQVAVDGRIAVPSGEITLRQLPEGAVAVSEDVVVINRQDGAGKDERPTPAAGWAVTTDIELVLGERVTIEGYGLEGRLAGNLRLRQRPAGVQEAAGELRIEEGRYRAYGQDLEIRRGQLLFSGPLREPALNVEAVRRADNVVAGLRVEGQPDAPQVTLFSEPALPQEEILSYIVRGRPLQAGGDGTSEQLLAQAALSLGIFGGKGFAGSLAEELGVEDFELGTAGEGETTQVELSGYITSDLLVRYGIGVFEPVNTLTLRYQINDNFFVEAVSGLESALDFFYEWEF